MISVVCTLLCGLALWRSNILTFFCCGKNPTDTSIQNSECFIVQSKFTFVHLSRKLTWITPFLFQKVVAMIFPADGTLLNFFVLVDVVWHHSVYCQLYSGSKWCTPRSLPVGCHKYWKMWGKSSNHHWSFVLKRYGGEVSCIVLYFI